MCLQLSKKVQLNNKIKVVKLPKTEVKIKDNSKCWVAGWGLTKTGGKPTSELLSVDVHPLSLDTCKKKWKSINVALPDTVMCAGGSSEDEGKGFCQVSS